MPDPTKAILRLVKPWTGAGAVNNAARQCQKNWQLVKVDLAIYERTGEVPESLVRMAEHEPDRLKSFDLPDGLLEDIDRLLLCRLFERDIRSFQDGGELTNRLEVAMTDPVYLSSLGVNPDLVAYLGSRMSHPSNR
jgi:hypothetical protein